MEVDCDSNVVAANGCSGAAGTTLSFRNIIRGFDGSLICNGEYLFGENRGRRGAEIDENVGATQGRNYPSGCLKIALNFLWLFFYPPF